MSSSAAWVWLVIAGLVEIAWAAGIKYTQGWTRLWPSVTVLALYLLDIFLLSIPMSRLPVGTAYSVWVGIGSLGATIAGIVLFGEAATPGRMLCIALILAGVIGLKIQSS
jgi:quaternary ammonium compound-resistance protein SugE